MVLGILTIALFVLACVLHLTVNWKFYVLIYKIRGLIGILQQPLLFVIVVKLLDPRKILEVLPKIRKRFKTPLAVFIGLKCLLYLDDPIYVERVYNSPECLDKTFLQEGFFTNRGLLHARGEKWKIRRKQLNPTFSYAVLISFLPTFNSVGNSLQFKFEELLGKATSLKSIEDVINRAVLVAACQTTMGTETNFIENDETGIAQAYKTLIEISSMKVFRPWLQIEWLFKMTNLHKLDKQYNDQVDNFVRNIIMQKRNESGNFNGDEYEEKKKRNFIDHIFHLAQNGEMTWEDINDESNSMVLVAFETVSSSLLMTILCLSMYPEYQDKLREEIYDTFPNKDCSEISADDIRNMKYLDMVVSEGLRLLPTVPLVLRNVRNDILLQDELVLPKGTFVLVDSFHVHRNQQHWGPRAEEFYPDHFLPESVSKRHPFAYIPFSKGLRFCIGWRYSLLLSKILLVKLLSKYRFETNIQLKDLQFFEGISLKIKNHDCVQFNIKRLDEN